MILTDLLQKNNIQKEKFDIKIGEVIPKNFYMISPKYKEKVQRGGNVESVSKNIEILAKNTQFLPVIAKTIDILKSSIISLSKIALERNKKINLENLKLREDIYESKFDRTPSKLEKVKPSEKANKIFEDGMFDKIFDFGSAIFGIAGLMLNRYFKNPKFKNLIDSSFNYLKENLKEAFDKLSDRIFGENIGEKFSSNLAAIGIGLTAAVASIKLAFSFFSNILKSAGKLIAKSIGLNIPEIGETPDRRKERIKNGDKDVRREDKSESKRVLRKRSDSDEDKNRIKKFKKFAEKVAKNGWKDRLFDKLKKRFGFSLALKAAAFIGGMIVPVAGWLVTAVAFGLLAADAYALYEEIFRPGGIEDELEKEDSILNKKVNVIEPDFEMYSNRIENIDYTPENIISDNKSTQIKSGFDYERYTKSVAKKESSDNYKADNGLGYLGKYQFGASALETFGYLKPGSSKNNQYAVYSPQNWTGKDGINNQFDFLNNPEVQEKVMRDFTRSNYMQLKKSGVITNEMESADIAGALYAAHHGGVGGASKYFLRGIDTADKYFPSETIGKSATYMTKEYNRGKFINDSSMDLSKNSQPIQFVDASTINNVSNNNDGSQQPIQLSQANVLDRDLTEMLLKNMWGN